jgi:uncharacterized protein (TIGR03437 family)
MFKYCAVLSLCAGLGLAADYITGQGARLVIGQTTFTSQNFGVYNNAFGAAGGLAFANNTLFVADDNRLGLLPNNNRVLMFGNMSGQFPQPTSLIPNFSGRCPVCGGQATMILGQPPFGTSCLAEQAASAGIPVSQETDSDCNLPGVTQQEMNLPLAVASDGVRVAIADTANNRVLIWNSFPTTPEQNADLVLGQPNFTTIQNVVVNASSMRAPQGVWIQNNELFVADTQNNRVLIWTTFPTQNNQPANLVLGASNFTTVPNQDQTTGSLTPAANTMLTPISVSSDGTHLFITDLGFSRVLIFNSIPTANNVAADVEVGQLNMVTAIPDDATDLCGSNGTDSNGNPTFPAMCASTMNFPRFALSDGTRLYVADGGDDRVMIWETIPTTNGQGADVILGQPDEFSDVVTSNSSTFEPNLTQSASNVTPTPTSLAWDGTNLYVADPSDFRILVFTPAQADVPENGVVNAASREIFAIGTVTLSGTITAGNTITVTIGGTAYEYTIVAGDTFDTILTNMANLVNANGGDPNVLATPELGFQILQLVARAPGNAGNLVTLTVAVSTNATISVVASDSTLTGGGSASTVAPGALVSILGSGLSNPGQTFAADPNATQLPYTLGGVQVYVDGIQTPLLYVSPTAINAMLPYEIVDSNSSSLYVRIQHADGSVSVTDAIGLPVAPQNPGIFAQAGQDPRPAIIFHASSYANGIVSVDGSIVEGDVATIGIQDRSYNYTVQASDTLADVRDALISLINANTEEVVVASAANAYTRVLLRAKVPGPEGDGIAMTGTSTSAAGAVGSVTLSALNTELCCANVAGAPVTSDNPAVAGETVYILATGLGLVLPDDAKAAQIDGAAYQGPAANDPNSPVSSLVGGSDATVVSAGLIVGGIGVNQVVLELSNALTTNATTQLTISQDIYTSNIVVFPVVQPNPNH